MRLRCAKLRGQLRPDRQRWEEKRDRVLAVPEVKERVGTEADLGWEAAGWVAAVVADLAAEG